MIRVRRIPKGRHFRRQYEVAFVDSSGALLRPVSRTSAPIFEVERELHTADAWWLIESADRLWSTHRGAWAEWPPPELRRD